MDKITIEVDYRLEELKLFIEKATGIKDVNQIISIYRVEFIDGFMGMEDTYTFSVDLIAESRRKSLPRCLVEFIETTLVEILYDKITQHCDDLFCIGCYVGYLELTEDELSLEFVEESRYSMWSDHGDLVFSFSKLM